MRLDVIQELKSVNEIYEYILSESTKLESVNKNLKKSEWHEYGLDNFHVYLCNTYVNKNEVESSLDLLFISNAKAFKMIYQQEEDSENIIEQSRVVIYYLLRDYFEGLYDNEVYRNFGFRINGDIEQFKKLFLKENVDMFCSHLLIKAKQDERRSLNNRIVKAVKDTNGWKTIVEYENYNFVSYEESFCEDKQDIDSYLYEKGELKEEEIIKPFKADNIFSYMRKNLNLLTNKQQKFIKIYSDEDTNIERLFKANDNNMSKELKYQYKKNIIKKFEEKLFMNNKNIKKTKKGYYVLKMDSSSLLSKLDNCKDKKEQFLMVSKLLKRNDEVGKLINEIAIESDCMSIFAEYFNKGFTKEVMRFLYGKKFELILNRLKDKGDDKDVSRENRTVKNCI